MSILGSKNDIFKNFDLKYLETMDGQNYKEHLGKNFQNWCYDLSLGEEVYITSEEFPRLLSETSPYVNIRPGEFAQLITYEKLKLRPDIMAFISVKFTYKKKGLINISGFHVDPGYEGKIIFSVYNAGPNDILIKFKDPVFMIFFEKVIREDTISTSNESVEYRQGYEHIPVSIISEIKGQSTTLADNRQKIEKLEQMLKIYGAIAIAIITTLIGALLTK